MRASLVLVSLFSWPWKVTVSLACWWRTSSMKWPVCTNMPAEPQAGSSTRPWSGSMMLTIMRTSEGGVKNSPPSWAPLMANLLRKYS
jgi:hypothetical protein